MTGFTADLYRFMLLGIKISISHDIKLRMAICAVHSSCRMHVPHGSPFSDKQGNVFIRGNGSFDLSDYIIGFLKVVRTVRPKNFFDRFRNVGFLVRFGCGAQGLHVKTAMALDAGGARRNGANFMESGMPRISTGDGGVVALIESAGRIFKMTGGASLRTVLAFGRWRIQMALETLLPQNAVCRMSGNGNRLCLF